MNSISSSSTWINKAILITLLVCLACLGVLIYQNNQRALEERRRAEASNELLRATQSISVHSTLTTSPSSPPANGLLPAGSSAIPDSQTSELDTVSKISESPHNGVGNVVVDHLLPVSEEHENSSKGENRVSMPALGGSLFGKVTLWGEPPPERPIRMDGPCERLQTDPVTTRFHRVNDENGLADVLVYIELPASNSVYAPPTEPQLLDNVQCMFEPYVMAVQVGQEFLLRNSDPIMHNYHFTFRNNKERNLASRPDSPVISLRFDSPELFGRIKCDVHPWMFAYVSVFDHPFFAVTDEDGAFHIPAGLPVGRYTLVAHHRKLTSISKEIVIEDRKPQEILLTLAVSVRDDR